MGIGEPLDAYPAVLGSLRTLCAPWGLDLAPRRITLSTVGRPERIRQLAEEGPGVHLAISLHAGRQETRDLLIPRNRCPATLEEIVTAGRDYATRTGRDVTFEYVLVAGINDTRAEAEALARLLGGRHLILNLIPANPVAGTEVRPPSQQVIHRFRNIVQEGGLVVTIRKRRGRQVEAACGQLLPRGPART
jgi:23S rRNA (adenine2503-C2)-methyltransferase